MMQPDDSELDSFRAEVMFNILLDGTSLTVTNDVGELPVVACLDSEPIATLLERVTAAGGFATVFSRGADVSGQHLVRRAAFVSTECAIETGASDMTPDAPAPNATIGLFLDYLGTQPGGVILPKSLGLKAGGVERPSRIEFQTV